MGSLIYIFYLLLLFALSWGYFQIARKYRIVDLPNHRTMHVDATIRGGGVVVLLGVLIYSILFGELSYYFSIGLCLIGITGFLDDLIDLSSKARLIAQVISMLFILAELDMWDQHFVIAGLIILIGVGVLNAYNFMDGINGITGGYSLVTGSLSIAFIIVFLITNLINETNQLVYILFLTLYGIDTIFTLIQRLALRENIFKAHRMHLFQVGINRTGGSHLLMSLIYAGVQIVINIIVIVTIRMTILDQALYLGTLLAVLSLIYIRLKRKIMPEIS